jgi:hypothetical protein
MYTYTGNDGEYLAVGATTPAGVPVAEVIETLSHDYLIIPRKDLPEVTSDGRLPSTFGRGQLSNLPSERAAFYWSEGLDKIALSLWSAKAAERRERDIKSLTIDLEQTLEHSNMTSFAESLVNRGWRRG